LVFGVFVTVYFGCFCLCLVGIVVWVVMFVVWVLILVGFVWVALIGLV